MIDLAMRWFLVVYFTSVAGFYLGRLLLWRRTHGGRSAQCLGPLFSRHWWAHRAFRLFRMLIWGLCVARLFTPAVDRWLGSWTTPAPILLAGAGLMILGLALAVRGHRELGEAWRSGIDPEAPPQLVTSGLYAWSRNPMAIGIQIAQLGFFLAWPSWFSFVVFMAGVTAIQVHVRLEESDLARRVGQAYARYCAVTPRWIGSPVQSQPLGLQI
jgi:protein-S-isoprenylcysteine O-methyltransferase Ste14